MYQKLLPPSSGGIINYLVAATINRPRSWTEPGDWILNIIRLAAVTGERLCVCHTDGLYDKVLAIVVTLLPQKPTNYSTEKHVVKKMYRLNSLY